MDTSRLVILNPHENVGYGPRPIPTARDIEIISLIAFAIEASELKELGRQVETEHWAVLRSFAERQASLAVRTKDPEALRIGLIALCLAGLVDGSRDALTILPLYYHAAGALSLDRVALFSSVAVAIGQPAVDQLEGFLARNEEDKSLEAMGYRVGHDKDGFRYEREW